MKKIITLVAICVFKGIIAQNISEYQYVVVPKKFEFQRTENQYQINGLTKFLFEKYNFSTFWSDEIPREVHQNPCDMLKADVQNKSGMFVTKVIVTLIDCNGKIVFTSREGKSREKNYDKAYNEALRDAFEDIKALNYKYTKKDTNTSVFSQIQEIQSKEQVITTNDDILPADVSNTYPILYAQPIENGYQLIDKTPKIILKLQKTSLENIYNAIDFNNINGVFYKKEAIYIFEFTKNGQTEKIFYNVNFPK